MKNSTLKNKLLFSWCVCFMISCSETNDKKQVSTTPVPSGLSSIVTTLPEAPGYSTFQNNCVSCHSARYVQMQPHLSEKTWMALVTKMQKTFGAPIADSSVNEIVKYLVAIKGKRWVLLLNWWGSHSLHPLSQAPANSYELYERNVYHKNDPGGKRCAASSMPAGW